MTLLVIHILMSSFLLSCFHSGLNFIDLMVRQGNIDNPPKTPLVPGFECSGIVEALGDNVKGYEVTQCVVMCDWEEPPAGFKAGNSFLDYRKSRCTNVRVVSAQ